MRLSSSRRVRAAAAMLAAAPLAARAQDDSTARRPFAPTDVYRIVTVAAPSVSPDGRRVAFTVTRVDEQGNRRRTEVWTAPLAGAPPTRLSWPDSQASAPRYLPDGRLVFTVSSRGGASGGTAGDSAARARGAARSADSARADGRPRSYVVRPETDARPVRIEGLPPAGASWASDGRTAVWADSIVASADSAGGEFSPADSAMREPTRGDTVTGDTARRVSGPGGAAARPDISRPPHGAVTRPLDQKRFDGRHVVDFPYKDNDRGFVANRADARRWRPTQLWAATAGDTARRQLTTAPYSHRDAALSPDGRTVAFVADTALRPDSVVQAERDSVARLPYDRRRDDADRNEGELFVRPLGAGEPRRLTTIPGAKRDPVWGPTGRRSPSSGSRAARSRPRSRPSTSRPGACATCSPTSRGSPRPSPGSTSGC
jgi:dipeptidyl aminopeptidase/acylaminoacyl peptidase